MAQSINILESAHKDIATGLIGYVPTAMRGASKAVDKIVSMDGAHVWLGEEAGDIGFGGNGFDATLIGGEGRDVVRMDTALGDFTVLHASGLEAIIGGDGFEVIQFFGENGQVAISGIEIAIGGIGGTDRLKLGNGGNDIGIANIYEVEGGYGHDRVRLFDNAPITVSGIEELQGAGENLVQFGDYGNDTSISGVKTIAGGAEYDRVTIGKRTDGGFVNEIEIAGAVDELQGSEGGFDMVTLLDGFDHRIVVGNVGTVRGGDGNDTIIVQDPIDLGTLFGDDKGIYLDDLFGDSQPAGVYVSAGAGDDVLIGGSGDDVLIGGSGDDVLIGGSGADMLIGGSGPNLFVADDRDCVLSSGNDMDTVMLQGGEVTINVGMTREDMFFGSRLHVFHDKEGGTIVSKEFGDPVLKIMAGTSDTVLNLTGGSFSTTLFIAGTDYNSYGV